MSDRKEHAPVSHNWARAARSWAIVLVAFALVPALGTVASATTPPLSLRRVPALFRSALRGRGITSDIFSAKRISDPINHEGKSASFFFGDPADDYGRWYVDIWSTRRGPEILIETQQDSSDSFSRLASQVYAWEATLPAADVHFGKGLRGFSIHTGQDLAPFGSLNMHLTHATRPHARTVRCHATGKTLERHLTRYGRLRGSISLTPRLSFMPKVVHATSAPAFLESVSKTKHHCPNDHCYPEEFLQASDTNGDVVLAARDFIIFEHDHPQVAGVRTGSAIFVLAAHSTALRIDHGAATIDASRFGPLLEGSMTLVPGDTSSGSATPDCTTERDSYDGYGGTLSAGFDSGTIVVHGSSTSGQLTKVHHTR